MLGTILGSLIGGFAGFSFCGAPDDHKTCLVVSSQHLLSIKFDWTSVMISAWNGLPVH